MRKLCILCWDSYSCTDSVFLVSRFHPAPLQMESWLSREQYVPSTKYCPDVLKTTAIRVRDLLSRGTAASQSPRSITRTIEFANIRTVCLRYRSVGARLPRQPCLRRAPERDPPWLETAPDHFVYSSLSKRLFRLESRGTGFSWCKYLPPLMHCCGTEQGTRSVFQRASI